jgi:hypothetical protein
MTRLSQLGIRDFEVVGRSLESVVTRAPSLLQAL